MIVPRYAPAVCVLLALASIPTFIYGYAGVVVDDGRRTSAIASTVAAFSSSQSDRRSNWGKRLFDSDDWFERRYESGADEVLLTVIRSFDLKSLYHHPELAVAYGTPFTKNDVQFLGPDGRIPVHVLETADDTGPVALYVLHYGNQFVTDPIRFQLRTAADLLFSGRRQMTLFFATGERRQAGQSVRDLSWSPVLLKAIGQFVGDAGAVRARPVPIAGS